jgi:hypothetical protein
MSPLIPRLIEEFGVHAVEALADALLARDVDRAKRNAAIIAETDAGIVVLRKLAGKDPVTGK